MNEVFPTLSEHTSPQASVGFTLTGHKNIFPKCRRRLELQKIIQDCPVLSQNIRNSKTYASGRGLCTLGASGGMFLVVPGYQDRDICDENQPNWSLSISRRSEKADYAPKMLFSTVFTFRRGGYSS